MIGWMPASASVFGEFERAEQIVGVGQRERRRTVGSGERGELLDGQRAFEQRIGRVHPKMHEGLRLTAPCSCDSLPRCDCASVHPLGFGRPG